jgi:Flp pilus assembly protein TadB
VISTPVGRLRATLAILLVVSAALFAVGAMIERSTKETESTATESEHRGSEEEATESAEGQGGEEAGEPGSEAEESERLFGIDLEQPWLIGLAVAVSVGLAVATLLRPGRGLFVLIVAFGLAFAALDARELVHQSGESNAGLVAIAATLVVMHLGVAVVAWRATVSIVRSH